MTHARLLVREASSRAAGPLRDRTAVHHWRAWHWVWATLPLGVACAPNSELVAPQQGNGGGDVSTGSSTSVGTGGNPTSGGGGAPASGGASAMAWGAPQPIDELNSAFLDTHSSMSDDKLIICFASDRPGGVGLLDIWCAKRTAADAPFDAPMNQTAINTPEWDSYPVLTADGGTLYYTARPQGDPDNIYRASWNGTAFVNPVAVTPLNSNSADRAAAALDTDVYFHSDRAGSDDIYSGTRVGDGPWQNIAPVAILNTEYGDGEPRRRGNRLVFCSTRPGAGTLYGSTQSCSTSKASMMAAARRS
jgi:WD40 repeat protein